MKPIAELPLDWKNHFWTLLIGGCWHEWELSKENVYGVIHCRHCKASYEYFIDSEPPEHLKPFNFYASLSGFQIIKEHMEKEMPEVWESYIEYYFTPRTRSYRDTVSEILSLDNLLSFLLSNAEEWGWKECQDEDLIHDEWCDCNGTGKVKHPALVFAESLKEER